MRSSPVEGGIRRRAGAPCGGARPDAGGGSTMPGGGSPTSPTTTIQSRAQALDDPATAANAAAAIAQAAQARPAPGSVTQSSNVHGNNITTDAVEITATYGSGGPSFSVRNATAWSIGTGEGNPGRIERRAGNIQLRRKRGRLRGDRWKHHARNVDVHARSAARCRRCFEFRLCSVVRSVQPRSPSGNTERPAGLVPLPPAVVRPQHVDRQWSIPNDAHGKLDFRSVHDDDGRHAGCRLSRRARTERRLHAPHPAIGPRAWPSCERPSMTSALTPAPTLGTPARACYRPRPRVPDDARASHPRRTRP